MIQPTNTLTYYYSSMAGMNVVPTISKSQKHDLPALNKSISTPVDVYQSTSNPKATSRVQSSYQPSDYSAISNSGIMLSKSPAITGNNYSWQQDVSQSINNVHQTSVTDLILQPRVNPDLPTQMEMPVTVSKYEGEMAKRAYMYSSYGGDSYNATQDRALTQPQLEQEVPEPQYVQKSAPQPNEVPEFSQYNVPSYDAENYQVGSTTPSDYPKEVNAPSVAEINEPRATTISNDEFYRPSNNNFLNSKAIEAYGIFTSSSFQNLGGNFNYLF